MVAFAFLFSLASMIKKKIEIEGCSFFLALLTGYSRIYLSQHFLRYALQGLL